MPELNLTHELVLLAYDDQGVNRLGTPNLDQGLGGALLLELALAGRVEVTDGRLAVADPTPTGQPLLDEALVRIRTESRPRRPQDWITRLGRGLREQVLDELVAAGVLRREAGRVLGVFPRTRFPSRTGAEPVVETEARQRMRTAVTTDGPVDPRTAALIGLTRALDLHRKVFRDLPKEQVARRIAEIGAGDWASAATRRAVQETQMAIITATSTAAIIATTTVS
ncbi:GOLPH3/VPS74 family protein [Micromonospora cathayae]|uniref:GPP34 family phosphoprotein n=1 Tax=Micromonospora cathayae TaxID=3028804 RepID=A0ABY7ZSS9_9ACTN|nr:GPP34 family phosphoprotein [Micromonospora sp. HUAS 3]WDZ86092.1 GPP34 family phosphoprotein [Micromonospora sp. HUAS 3]